MTLSLLIFLAACGGDKSGEVFTRENAPWSMDSARVFLFKSSGDNNGREGSGVLAITTSASTGCKDIRGGVPEFGSGLWFVLSYFTGRSIGSASPAWDGLYVAGEGTATDTPASRSLMISGWHEGFQYDFSATDAWLDVKYGSRDRFAGDFSTQWWSGTFDAQVCEGGDVNSDVPGDEEGQDEDTGGSE